MTDIVEFLRARYAEHRRTAEDAVLREDTVWRVCENSRTLWGSEEPDVEVLAAGKPIMRFNGEYNGALIAAHVILHSPASVLADINAKLLLVEDFAEELAGDPVEARDPVEASVHEDYDRMAKAAAMRGLRILALPFAGHQDYREEWRL